MRPRAQRRLCPQQCSGAGAGQPEHCDFFAGDLLHFCEFLSADGCKRAYPAPGTRPQRCQGREKASGIGERLPRERRRNPAVSCAPPQFNAFRTASCYQTRRNSKERFAMSDAASRNDSQ
ncbi:hypothetical protein LG3211_0546 [Lysobacter gummosus]|nr:hypothetical protein LG3211_0546 [Lysobacter gummosus]